MIQVVARNFIKPENISKALEMYRELVRETRKEKGCIAYDLFQDPKNTSTFVFIETWECDAALQAHFEAPHFKKLIPAVGALASQEGCVDILEKIM